MIQPIPTATPTTAAPTTAARTTATPTTATPTTTKATDAAPTDAAPTAAAPTAAAPITTAPITTASTTTAPTTTAPTTTAPTTAPTSAHATSDALGPTAQRELLWKALQRFDHYVSTMNTKAGLVVALNTFLLGGAVMKWTDINKAFSNTPTIGGIAMVVLALVALASLVSIALSLLAINPITRSSVDSGEYRSIIFFEHVAQFDSPERYLDKVKCLTEQQVRDDCATQVYAVAQVTNTKVVRARCATLALLLFELPLIGLLVVLKVISSGLVLLGVGGL